MSLQLFGHPFSSYTMKALIALYENATPFDFRILGPDHPDNAAEWMRRWPVAKFPVLVDGDTTIVETSAIIEHLDAFHPGPVKLIPADAKQAVPVRMLDRVFDSHVMTPMQAIVANAIRPDDSRDPHGVEQARTALDRIYAWLDETLAGCKWAAGDAFTLADAAAAPSLFYADWVHPIAEPYTTLKA
jgi:glutathione S-transferase